ncbi:MAG: cyclic nucleotide-binding domain-containing protein, partial [Planctomycetales bacterium]|nr:cyclic nucleotide-binding domain-containing protein [Planctomycetales bacterium]
MLRKEVQVERPSRWDVPLDDQLTSALVDRMLQIPPFSRMDADRFPASCPLRGILQNDTRIVSCKPGDLIVREGDYGNSAFMLITGTVVVTLDPLPAELIGRPKQQRWRKFIKLLRHLRRPRFAEVRQAIHDATTRLGQRHNGAQTQLFLQDVPGILNRHRTLQIRPGEFFGEIAALARTQRTASVIATHPAQLLEIRWQGLRDLMKYAPKLRQHIEELYRQNSLSTHLRQTPLFAQLDKAQLKRVCEATQFETFGNFEWNQPYQKLQQASIN